MRRTLLATVALGGMVALAVAGISVAAKPTVVRAGNLVMEINGGVSPTKLPRRTLAPIALRASGNIRTTDGTQPPALREVRIDFDEHGTINARGLSVCRSGQLQARDTQSAKAACRASIVGQGRTRVRVAFPESTPFETSGPLVIFNGGVRRGVTTMFIHAYVNVPAPTAIVTTVQVRKIRQGRYGTRAIARIPVIAGGSGSVTSFNLTVRRNFRANGRRQSYLLARCGRGRLFAKAVAFYRDGTRLTGNIVRPCRPR